MAEKKIYVDGFRTFAPHPNSPEWVKGTLVIDIDAFTQFIENNRQHFTQYQGKDQLKIQITKAKNDDRLSFSIDTYKGNTQQQTTRQVQQPTQVEANTYGELPEPAEDLPF